MTSPMDRKLSILLCLSMALTLAGCAAEEEAPLMDPTVTVEVAEVQSGSLSNDGTYIGTISAEGTASVIPLVSGTVEKIAVSVGDTVNVGDLERFEDGSVVDAQALAAAGLVKKALDGVKVLGQGELTKKLTVNCAAFSASAKEKIEKAGGKAEVK